MRPKIEQSLYIEFEELFSLRERLRTVADQIRAGLMAAGLRERLEVELFDQELELRSSRDPNLQIRLDSYHLEITGIRSELSICQLAALILSEAEVFRLTSVEVGFTSWYQAEAGRSLHLVAPAFGPMVGEQGEPVLDRRFAMTWEWSSATAGYSFHANCTEDRELMLGLKVREGYMTLPELHSESWFTEQRHRYDQGVSQFLTQLGWQA